MKPKVIIYIDHIFYADGIYTWMCNFIQLFSNKYNIQVLTNYCKEEMKHELMYRGVEVLQWDATLNYSCDVLLQMLDFVVFPKNIECKKKYKIVHCNYGDLNPKSNFKELDDGSKFIAVSEQAAKGFTKRFKLPCDAISSFIIPYDPRPIMHIISCSRVYNNKGFERMFHLADDLDECGIRFEWINYSEIDKNGVKYLQEKEHKYITFLPALPHNKLLDRIAECTYLVQLSDKEGYCYAVHESLSLGTPVIVTDIDAFKDIVIDGYNGYKLPLEMDYGEQKIKDIVNNVPNDFTYFEDMSTIYKKWKEVLSV